MALLDQIPRIEPTTQPAPSKKDYVEPYSGWNVIHGSSDTRAPRQTTPEHVGRSGLRLVAPAQPAEPVAVLPSRRTRGVALATACASAVAAMLRFNGTSH